MVVTSTPVGGFPEAIEQDIVPGEEEEAVEKVQESALLQEKLVEIPVDAPHIRFSFRTFFKYAGPGWLMSLAYLDPGNLEADLQAGAFTGYQLIWVLFLAHVFGLILQVLAARIGTVTGLHLAEHCRRGYPRATANVLWIMTEIAIIGADIQEVLGTAIALQVIFGIPLWAGALITALDTITFLAIHLWHGIRIVEAFICSLIVVMMGCFFTNMAMTAPPPEAVLAGFIPSVSDYAVMQMVGVIGAVIMPHNLYLHSALVKSRKIDRKDDVHVKQANKYFLVDSCLALLISFLVNLAVISAFAHGLFAKNCAEHTPGKPMACMTDPADWSAHTCSPSDPSCQCVTPMGDPGVCGDVGLVNAASALASVMSADAAKYIFAFGVLAAGQASTLTGTFAGQYVMEGFMQWKIPVWLRVVITRSIALGPALAMAIMQSEIPEMNAVNSWLNILQCVQLPFALLPVLHFSISKSIMKKFAIGPVWTAAVWSLAFLIIGINFYLIVSTLVPMEPAWYAWLAFTFAALLYLIMCFKCVEDDIYSVFRKQA